VTGATRVVPSLSLNCEVLLETTNNIFICTYVLLGVFYSSVRRDRMESWESWFGERGEESWERRENA